MNQPTYGQVPGTRTNPTIKQSPQANQRLLKAWQVNLGALQVCLLLGVILGCMACSFYLGFFSGQKAGIEVALSNNIANALKFPISNDTDDTQVADGSEDAMTDVYAKLNTLDNPKEPLLAAGQLGAGQLAVPQQAADANSIKNNIAQAKQDLEAVKRAVNEPSHVTEQKEVDADAKTLEQEKSFALAAAAGGIEVGSQNSAPTTIQQTGSPQVKVLGSGNTAVNNPRLNSKENVAPSLGQVAAIQKTQLQKAEVQKVEPAVAAQDSNPKLKEEIKPIVKTDTEKPTAALKTTDTKKTFQVTTTLPRGWFAQIAAPDNRTEAESLTSRITNAGFSVVVENAQVRGQQYYRILVGPEETRQQAERLITQLKREPSIKGEPFIRMVR